MPFSAILARNESQTSVFRVWTGVPYSIYFDVNYNTKRITYQVFVIEFIMSIFRYRLYYLLDILKSLLSYITFFEVLFINSHLY